MPLTVGTAGHIDHGKTWLVRALTGKDTDRLPEEQRRGISIDLGYAPLVLPDGRTMSLVDVPGHERFVRAMVAGASGIDLFLLAIDVREGARPQTLEHLAVLRLLGVDRGVVAVTKADSVDEGAVSLAVDAAGELVPGVEVVPVSATTGRGLDELRDALARVEVPERDASTTTRLWVDRVFSLAGAGTIATGTLWSGRVAAGDVLRLEPGGRTARVRSVQVHDVEVAEATAGQRVAVNLPSLARREIARGDQLVAGKGAVTSYRLDVRLEELAPIPAAVTVHVGTTATPARVARDGAYAQLRLARPVAALRGDRVILRVESTVGGGAVIDPAPPRGLDIERMRLLELGDALPLVHRPVEYAALEARGLRLDGLLTASGYVFAESWLEEQRASVHARLAARAEAQPLDPGLPANALLPDEPWAATVLGLLQVETRAGKAYLPGVAASIGAGSDAADDLLRALEDADTVRVTDRELGAYLEGEGRIRRVGDGLAVSAALYERGRELLSELDEITLPRFRDALGVGRRTAQLLLERYDADGITRRRGDVRVLRRP